MRWTKLPAVVYVDLFFKCDNIDTTSNENYGNNRIDQQSNWCNEMWGSLKYEVYLPEMVRKWFFVFGVVWKSSDNDTQEALNNMLDT